MGVPTAIAAMVVAPAGGTTSAMALPASETIDARVDRLFARWQRPDFPGCGVGVSRGVTTVLERGYGTASLEHRVPITPASVFHVASVTKQFTAMSILLLAREGKLSLDDDVRRHLLTHTAGLGDAFLLIELAAPHDGSRSRHDQLVGLLARQRGLSEEPGRRYAYNNGGYLLLAQRSRIPNDMFIAAHALSRGLVLVTDDVREFRRVKGLKIESWR